MEGTHKSRVVIDTHTSLAPWLDYGREGGSLEVRSATGAVLFRDLCVLQVKIRYPGIEPRNDWELLYLAEQKVEGSVDEVYATLEEEYIQDIKFYGFEECEEMIAQQKTLSWSNMESMMKQRSDATAVSANQTLKNMILMVWDMIIPFFNLYHP